MWRQRRAQSVSNEAEQRWSKDDVRPQNQQPEKTEENVEVD